MKKEKAKLIQISGTLYFENGEKEETTNYTVCFILTEKEKFEIIFSETDEDNQDKYLFRDLDYLKTLGKEIYKINQKYELIEEIENAQINLIIKNGYFVPTKRMFKDLKYENSKEYFKKKTIKEE